jgi:hypothetical protein
VVMRQHTSGMPALGTAWSFELDWVQRVVVIQVLWLLRKCHVMKWVISGSFDIS